MISSYLLLIALMLTILYFSLVYIVLSYFFKSISIHNNNIQLLIKDKLIYYFNNLSFEYTYTSNISYLNENIHSELLLLCTRIGSLCLIFIPYIKKTYYSNGIDMIHFTNWNLSSISIYFQLSFLSSIIGIYNDRDLINVIIIKQNMKIIPTLSYIYDDINSNNNNHDSKYWSIYIQLLSNAIQIMCNVLLSSSITVFIVVFTLLGIYNYILL